MFWAVLVMALLASARGQGSPCPAVFSYVVADGRPAGKIQISGFTYGQHVLELSMSLKIQLPSSNKGSIEMIGQEDLLKTITSGGVVHYRVNFPVQRPLPKVTAISFDGQLICSGPPETFDRPGQHITRINLKHKAKASLVEIPNSGNDVIQSRPQAARPPVRLPPSDSLDIIYSRPTSAPIRNEPQTQRTQRPPERVVNTSGAGRKCGLPQFNPNPLVLGGNTTTRGDWPWLATINLRRNFKYICTGSLVSQSVVVTAAHCITLPHGETMKARDLIVQLGVYDRVNYDEEDVETRNVRLVEYAPGRDASNNLFLDITVLVLDKPVTFSQFIIPVCLWSGSTNLNDIVGKKGSVVGWGKDEKGNLGTPDPRLLEVPVVSNEKCKASSPEFQFIEDPNDFCAGARDGISAPCNGDSGAGMYFWRNGRWELRGVVSFSLIDAETHTCHLRHYVVYTDAAMFRGWIENHINSN